MRIIYIILLLMLTGCSSCITYIDGKAYWNVPWLKTSRNYLESADYRRACELNARQGYNYERNGSTVQGIKCGANDYHLEQVKKSTLANIPMETGNEYQLSTRDYSSSLMSITISRQLRLINYVEIDSKYYHTTMVTIETVLYQVNCKSNLKQLVQWFAKKGFREPEYTVFAHVTDIGFKINGIVFIVRKGQTTNVLTDKDGSYESHNDYITVKYLGLYDGYRCFVKTAP